MNMKNFFPEYFKDKDEIEKIWKDCIFVFDANVILDLYRYSDPTKESLLKSLRYFKRRVWIPRQASEEYLRNRASVIASEETFYTAANNQIDDFLTKLKGLLEKRRQHPFISEKSAEEFFDAVDKVKIELSENGKKHFSRVSDDEIRKEIVDIFDGRVGEGFEEEELFNIFKEGATRYENKIPPGYEDVVKFKGDVNQESVSIDDKKSVYGDLIIWKEIIKKSISDKVNVVLITGDDKPDWWSVSKGKTLGPRVELIKEFENITGHKFYMYTAHNFLSISSKEIGGTSDEAAVAEMRNNLKDASNKLKSQFLSKKKDIENHGGIVFSKAEDFFDFELGMENENIVDDKNDSDHALKVKLVDLKKRLESVKARTDKYERDYKKLKDYDDLFGLSDSERERFLYLTELLRELRGLKYELENNIFFTQIEMDDLI